MLQNTWLLENYFPCLTYEKLWNHGGFLVDYFQTKSTFISGPCSWFQVTAPLLFTLGLDCQCLQTRMP